MNNESKKTFTDPIITPLISAVQFLTVIPPVIKRTFTPKELGQSVAYFPVVGLLIGGLLITIKTLFSEVFYKSISVGFVLAIWVIISGVIHLDGFLDACDGLFGGSSPEERLEIMRDKRLGSFAFAGGFLLLLLKYFSLYDNFSWQMMLAAPVIGRWAMTWLLVYFPYGRSSGLGKTLKENVSWQQAIIGGVLTCAVMVWLFGLNGIYIVIWIMLVITVLGYLIIENIPGLTGDIYGAMCEISELLMLLVGAGFGNQLWLN
jgi:adenosylcobinamide-GDP ribazoletransferase